MKRFFSTDRYWTDDVCKSRHFKLVVCFADLYNSKLFYVLTFENLPLTNVIVTV